MVQCRVFSLRQGTTVNPLVPQKGVRDGKVSVSGDESHFRSTFGVDTSVVPLEVYAHSLGGPKKTTLGNEHVV